jgi:hypothetical protein
MSDAFDETVLLADAPEAAGLGSQARQAPPGTFRARFQVVPGKDGEFVRRSTGGYPLVAGTWVVSAPADVAGSVAREWVVFAPKSLPFLKKRFLALGVPIPPGAARLSELAKLFAKKADGKEALVTFAHRERDDGRVFAEVVDLVRLPSPIETDDMKTLYGGGDALEDEPF